MADYYAEHAAGADPFNWIQVHPLMPPGNPTIPSTTPGVGETSLMLALAPEAVDMGTARRQQGLVHGDGGGRDARSSASAGVDAILAHLAVGPRRLSRYFTAPAAMPLMM